MRGYFAANRISEDEKSNILSQHKTLYNGYQTLNPEIPNTQPLYVQDFAKDKVGAVMGNKGNIKGYTNMGINEQSFPYGKSIVSEGECSECGYKMEEGMCSECGGMMQEGECSECGYKMEELDERTGKLDDIYDEEDLNPNAEFDYVKGASNKTNAYHVREQSMKTPIGKISAVGGMEEESELDEVGTFDLEKGKKYKYKLPDFEDEIEFEDEFEDLHGGEKMYKFKGKDKMGHSMAGKHIERFVDKIDEQGGNADDMDVDDVEPAYDFVSNGPMDGGDVYPVNELDEDSFDDLINMDSELEYDRDNLEQEEYEMMESAWADDIDEVDISGSQGIYGEMDPAYDFDSEGPGKGGPYQEYHGQTVSNDEGEVDEQWAQLARIAVPMAASYVGSKLADNNESEVKEGDDDEDFEKDDRSWEEIAISTGGDEFGYVDEDIRESLIIQRDRIMEMMNRMKVIK